ncbi:MAG: hypothetical protein R3B06_03245 [Kofleriaceae bacterium]
MRSWIPAVVVLAACGGGDDGPAVDASLVDAAVIDGLLVDGPVVDAAVVDAAVVDAAVVDAAVVDAAALDAAVDAPGPDAAPNRPPVVGQITGPAALVAGRTGTFAITATDPDGDTLSYAWSASGAPSPGTFSSAGAATTTWYSSDVASDGAATVTVSVSDGVNPPVARALIVPVAVPRFAADVRPIFGVCAGCHGTSGGLNLSAATAYANLVNVPVNNAACTPLNRVTPGAPDQSALILKISGTSCGNRMPRSDPQYFVNNPGLIVLIRSWILAGAAND